MEGKLPWILSRNQSLIRLCIAVGCFRGERNQVASSVTEHGRCRFAESLFYPRLVTCCSFLRDRCFQAVCACFVGTERQQSNPCSVS